MSTLKPRSVALYPGRGAAHSEAKWCAADPGSSKILSVKRSRISGAPLRAAPHPGNAAYAARSLPPCGAGLGRGVIGLVAATFFALASSAALADSPHLGKPVTDSDIKAWSITILPDGTGLPPGSGTAAQGAKLFDEKGCSACHGQNAKGGIANMLIGSPSLVEHGIEANKTIANFWGQATTLYDYIRRAMPWPTPHTLSNDEVYALCAYLLAGNKIIPEDEPMNAQTLPKVQMPNRNNFIIKFPDRI
jgi:S-disulfanyl-L-cysteine oxidoreductase SoxD